jgi:hypothetical protein
MSKRLWRFALVIPSVVALGAITPQPAASRLPCEIAHGGSWYYSWTYGYYCAGNPAECCH